ncbi:HsdM family class I SAM-dependent methyltransferase [Sodalinema gerasimenkoae]|uniref:HsdM family class I SAM-dependent methyltransferase n=1 Tax=Sodalinema gerasimenkoae TaxID=2862348 RepID=UPI00135A20FE|nr:class I SAM-dependent DNA methyltransferase [Sodalinema gerasimenkoae]
MPDISKLEDSLWEAADNLRANSKLNAAQYSMPVLGLIFLRHATTRFEKVKAEIEPTLPKKRGATDGTKRPIRPSDFGGRGALYLPENARYDYLLNLPETEDLGQAVRGAMEAIEEISPSLVGVLPKDYTDFEPSLLQKLVRVFDNEALKTTEGDVFGRIYEYFLSKFAMTGAQEGGEFFTPPSLVRTIVNIIEPERGRVFDPACGSGGMFVQTGYFVEQLGAKASEKLTFLGQEKNEGNTKLAKMNLAVHGLEGTVQTDNTFYNPRPDLIGVCDYVMSNPPFNVDAVDPNRIENDERLFTQKKIPGIAAKTGAVSNANYLWIQYYYSYLNETGRAGFVMASSASDAGHGEKEIRQEMVETGAVDVMVAIGTNFFYTRSLPCTLWFFDKGKPETRRDTVLMLDARNIYRVISRKLRDFSEEQLAGLTAIAWLYRGETDRYLALVESYLERLDAALAEISQETEPWQSWEESLADLSARLETLLELVGGEVQTSLFDVESEKDDPVLALTSELERLAAAWKRCASVRTEVKGAIANLGTLAAATNAEQQTAIASVEPILKSLKGLRKAFDEVHRLLGRSFDVATKQLKANKLKDWDSREANARRKQFDVLHDEVRGVMSRLRYWYQAALWLLSKFPDGVYADVPGLCRVVTRGEIAEQDFSLTPGRYVGVAPVEDEEDEEAFEERMESIHQELKELNAAAVKLAADIQLNFEELVG